MFSDRYLICDKICGLIESSAFKAQALRRMTELKQCHRECGEIFVYDRFAKRGARREWSSVSACYHPDRDRVNMAWNPSPKVADCRDIARKWRKQQVIILAIDVNAGTLEYASFGETKSMCDDAKRLADAAYAAVMKAYGECGAQRPRRNRA